MRISLPTHAENASHPPAVRGGATSPSSTRPSVFDLAADDFAKVAMHVGLARFRGEQVRRWVYDAGQIDPDRMTDLSAVDRTRLAGAIDFTPGEVTSTQQSADGTLKLLLDWGNGTVAETVMIPDGDRRTACVSSQVGCPVGCRFCASGLAGVKGNLSSGQIVEQVWRLDRILAGRGDSVGRVTNLVFMGMGEPLANYANVLAAIRTLNHPKQVGMGARRMTVSTVGVPAKIRQLADEDIPVNLAFSLHAPNEPLRRDLIPWACHFPLSDILDALRHYFRETGREITLEYILLSGVNDRPEHARELAILTKSLRANVNLIRYNEVTSLPFRRPLSGDVVRFQEILRRHGVNAHVRKSRGRDIDAACGQLRRKRQAASV